MKKILVLFLVVVLAVLAAMYWLAPPPEEFDDIRAEALSYCTSPNVAMVEVSQTEHIIKVTTSLLGGGSTYYQAGVAPVQCPVVGPDAVTADCEAFAGISDWETICATEARPSDEEAETVAFTFILDFIAVAPPEPEAAAEDRIMAVLSADARSEIHRDTITADLARFVGVQDVPDMGASVEDLQIVSDTEAYLVVGLNYSGGRVLRNVHLVVEDGTWKVDRVTEPEETEEFNATGNLVRNNPGLTPDVWHLVYEEPGQPALTVALEFTSASICADEDENTTCVPAELEAGTRVNVLGEIIDENLVQVVRLEMRDL